MARNGESLVSIFPEFFASINKFLFLAGRLATSLPFDEVQALSRYFLIFLDRKPVVVQQLGRQNLYSMLISNNRASFQL